MPIAAPPGDVAHAEPARAQGAKVVVLVLCALKLAVHAALITRYGYHRDELYFIECGRHPSFGYVDHPPLVPWIAGLADAVFGDNLVGLRALAVAAGVATVALSCRLVRELGGGTFACLVAGLCALIAPAFLRMASILCIPVFEPLFWSLGSLLVIRIARARAEPDGGAPARRRSWLWLGAVVGLGLLNKHSMLLWLAGIGAGVLATPLRAELRTRWPWLGLALAGAIFAPNLVWQAEHGFATVEFLRNLSSDVLGRLPRPLVAAGLLLYMHPLTAPVWIAGVVVLFRASGGRHRSFAVAFVVIVAALLVTRAKPYYLAPFYPLLFAAGAIAVERWLASLRHARRLRGALVVALAAGGVLLGLVALPALPVDRIDAGLEATLGGVVRPTELTGELHDEHGWTEQVSVVDEVSRSLAPEQRAATLVLTMNYGQASAVNVLGAPGGLPRAVSGHLNYWLWGLPFEPEVVIAYGMRGPELLRRWFEDVTEVARMNTPLAMPWERDLPVYLCRRPRVPLGAAWPALRRYTHGAEASSLTE